MSEITKLPSKILRSKIQDVSLEDIKNGSLKELISDMRNAIIEHNGVGLAANQLSKNLNLFVIEKKLADEFEVSDVYINTEITEHSKTNDEMEEGCLSIPGYFVEIPRSKKVMVKALDENGKKIKFRARGLLARVIQHEVDHLNGLVIKDRVKKIG